MLTNNLSTRPFYNESAIRLWLGLAVLLVAAATVFNVSRVLHYSRNDTELALQASRDETRASELRTSADRLRASVDANQITAASVLAREANDLIDRRTFSWTEVFNRFEATLPPEVRITAVRPRLDEKTHQITLLISVLARGVDDVYEFMEKLEETGAFSGVGSKVTEKVNDQGQLEAAFEMGYVPSGLQPVKGSSEQSRATTGAAQGEATR